MNNSPRWVIISLPDRDARQTQSLSVAIAYSRDPDCIVIDPLYWERILPDGKRVPLIEQTQIGSDLA
jgi:hypothetical protein